MPATKKRVAKKATTKKVMSKAVAPRNQKTAIATLQERLQQRAMKQAGMVDPTQSNKITPVSDDEFKMPDGSIVPAPMKVVILAFMARNVFYSRPYREGVVEAPDCAAQGFVKNNELTPFPKSELINQQHSDCKTCQKNQWDSNPATGGKACQNRKEVAVLATYEDGDGNLVDMTKDIVRFDVSPTGNNPFDSFVDKIGKRYNNKLPMHAFVVEAHPSKQRSGYTVVFKDEVQLPGEFVEMADARVDDAEQLLNVKPMLEPTEDQRKPKGRARTRAR